MVREPKFERGPNRTVALGWGAQTLEIAVPFATTVLSPPIAPPARPWAEVCDEALHTPVGSAPLAERLRGLRRVCVLVPDRTRKDVAEGLLPSILPRLARFGVDVSLGVATGKHPHASLGGLAASAWMHDASSPDLVRVGTTAEGTAVRFPREVLDAELRILLGEIRPHYFAGYAGGAKLLFPGVAGAEGIWQNHRLKASPGARLGQVEGNPCRADMEAAAALAGPSFLLNVLRGAHGGPVLAVSGDPVAAHREGVRRGASLFECSVPEDTRFDTVVVSDTHPVTLNLYQACKLLAPAGALLADGGTVILAASCAEGIGPVETINEAIYRLGLVHSLPARHRIFLVSERSAASVAPTFATYMPDMPTALAAAGPGRLAVLPYGGDLVPVCPRSQNFSGVSAYPDA